MTVAICFHYDSANRAHWDYLCRAYDILAYEIGTPEDDMTGRFEFIDSVADLPDCTLVGVQSRDAKFSGINCLPFFEHPKDVIYIFGHNHKHNASIHVDTSVHIPTHRCLWASQAAAIVLYDRYSKWLTK